MNVFRKCVTFLLFSALLFGCCISVGAAPLIDPLTGEVLYEMDDPSYSVSDPEIFAVEDTVSSPEVVEEDLLSDDVVEPVADPLDGSISLYANAPIESGDTSGLKAVLLDLLGPYEPILFTYSYGTNSTGREVFQDDVWLCSFWLLAIMVFCLFRMIGGWLTRKK